MASIQRPDWRTYSPPRSFWGSIRPGVPGPQGRPSHPGYYTGRPSACGPPAPLVRRPDEIRDKWRLDEVDPVDNLDNEITQPRRNRCSHRPLGPGGPLSSRCHCPGPSLHKREPPLLQTVHACSQQEDPNPHSTDPHPVAGTRGWEQLRR